MRIISGTHKGRHIKPPAGFKARPTTDQAREALFNILANQFNLEDLTIADLFGGTGAVTYEFSSRGVQKVYCIEKSPLHFKFIKKTIAGLRLPNIQIYRTDAFKAINKLPKASCDIVFADPPFDMPGKEKLIDAVMDAGILNNGILIFEHSDKESYNDSQYFIDQRSYGKVCFSFFAEKR